MSVPDFVFSLMASFGGLFLVLFFIGLHSERKRNRRKRKRSREQLDETMA